MECCRLPSYFISVVPSYCLLLWISLDLEMKKIIDKLAQFVARNGPEFEQMTKQKQKDNPQFGFLFGGLYFNYYQYRVTTEQISKCLSLSAIISRRVKSRGWSIMLPWKLYHYWLNNCSVHFLQNLASSDAFLLCIAVHGTV